MSSLRYLSVCMGLVLASYAVPSGAQTNPTRTANAPATTTVNEAPRLEVLTGDLNRLVSGFLERTQARVQQLEREVNTAGREVLSLCTLLYQTMLANGVPITVPIVVPDPNANLTPAQIQQFCRTVISIPPPPGGGQGVTITPPFVRTAIPPVCDYRRQDLAWQNGRWVCVDTMPAACINSPQAPQWRPVLGQ